VDRPTRHIISNDTAQFNKSWVPVHAIGVNRSLLPAKYYTFVPSAHGQLLIQAIFPSIKHTRTDLKD
jgi:hypothetical protein